jgi:hypothetical protein
VTGGQAPQSLADFDQWVADNVLSRFSPLFREARYLLAEEPDIRDNAVYHAVLSAVAEGNATRGGIAGYLERKATDISHHLSVLEDAGLLTREVDAFRPGRSIYRICEALVVFYHAIMRPEWSRLERRGQAAQVWRDSARRFAGSVVGPRFEQICRDWVQDFAPEEVLGGVVAQVGQGVVNDPGRKTAHQIDIAVSGNDATGQRVLLAIGEAKWAEPMGAGHLARLQRVRDLLIRNGQPGAQTARLLCFSAAEPSGQLRHAAAAKEVHLIGLDDLYGQRPDLPGAGEAREPGRTAASAAAAFSRPRRVQPAAARGRWRLAAGWSAHSGVPKRGDLFAQQWYLCAVLAAFRSGHLGGHPSNTALTRVMPCLSEARADCDWLDSGPRSAGPTRACLADHGTGRPARVVIPCRVSGAAAAAPLWRGCREGVALLE